MTSSSSGRPPVRDRPAESGPALWLARAALAWERLWPAAWPLLGILGLWLAFGLFDLAPWLPGWLHLAILVGFAVALGWAAVRFVREFCWPSAAAVRRRLERDSGLGHRPLSTLEDRLAMGAGDPLSEALWQAHRARMRAAIGRIRVRLPRPGLPRRDPQALRILLVLVLAIGLLDAAGDTPSRLARALSPSFAFGPQTPAAVQLWLTPPAYTRLPPIFLHAEEGARKAAAVRPVSVPAGSKILARFEGGGGTPRIVLGHRALSFKAVDDSTFQLEDALPEGDRITVEQGGRVVGEWPIAIVPDLPPTVKFTVPPSRTAHATLRLEYDADDDYGVATVRAEISRPGGPGGEAPVKLDLPVAGGHPRHVHETAFEDLTASPWAGLPAIIRLVATDEPGQIGTSAPVEVILPEREFRNPVAREIIAARKLLLRDPTSGLVVAQRLNDIAERPSRFGGDLSVFLSLVSARSHLMLDRSPAAVAPVQQQLWDTALAVEEGHLPMAERDVRALQQKLQDALAKGAPDSEIEKLVAQLEAAIDRYLSALANQAPPPGQPPGNNAQTVNSQDLHRLLERAREMARTGARDAARQLLSQLQDILENLRSAQSAQNSRAASGAAGLMNDIDKLIKQQDQLLDRTFRSAQDAGQSNRPGQTGEGDSAVQGAIRHQLGELMRRFGEMSGKIPGALGRAEQAMRQSESALGAGATGAAVGPQSRALENLREGRQAMLQSLRERLAQQGDDGSLETFGPSQDPLGRMMPGYGSFDGNEVQIPEHGAVQRAREIQDELQRRAGERDRPELELDYLDRLLKRF